MLTDKERYESISLGELDEWVDAYGETIHPGDSIRFHTLYGVRTVKISKILQIPQSEAFTVIDENSLVVAFFLEPLQVGPEKAFKPLEVIPSHSMWRPHKDIGRARRLDELLWYQAMEKRDKERSA